MHIATLCIHDFTGLALQACICWQRVMEHHMNVWSVIMLSNQEMRGCKTVTFNLNGVIILALFSFCLTAQPTKIAYLYKWPRPASVKW